MVGQRLSGFGGMIPLLSSRLLPLTAASAAVNVHLRGGEIRGIRQPSEIHDFNGVGVPTYKKAFRIPDPADPDVPVWVPFESRHADMYPNPLANDAFNRFIWLEGNAPGTATLPRLNSLERIKDEDPSLLLGVPPPDAAPSLAVVGGSGLIVTRAYVYTYVNLFGEEGAPSDSVTVSGYANGSWNLSALVDPSFAADHGIENVRIYRTISGTTGAAFFFVVEQIKSDSTYSDTALDSTLAAQDIQLESQTWAVPVEMEGIVAMPNGFFAGWTRNQIFFSEAYRPWAWPAEYGIATEYDILRCGVVDQTLVVVTAAMPVVVTGISPGNMSMSKLPMVEPCVEPNSVVASADGIYYASKNGLVMISASGMNLLTRSMIGRDEWNTGYIPKINAAAAFDSQYIVMGYDGDGFVFDFGGANGAAGGIIGLDRLQTVENMWTDFYTGEAHLIVENIVYTWSHPTAPFATADWSSKDFHFERQLNLGAFAVYFDPQYAAISTPAALFADSAQPVGSPWPEESSIVNYNQVNGCEINGAPTWGSAPPDNPTEAVWPYWYGVENDVTDYDLPEGVACMVSVFANDSLVWQGFVDSGRPYRLPSGFKSDLWRFQIKTRVPVLSFHFAETLKELRLV